MIQVMNPGFFSTVQDQGRWGYQAFGMPVAGAMDRYAYRIANMLAGNDTGAAALEMTMVGGSFHFTDDSYVAICGADMQAKLNGAAVAPWTAFLVPGGSELTFEYAVSGARAYLAVCGGIDVPPVLGSRSTYTRAGIGGHHGRALKAGDVLPVGRHNGFPAKPRALAAKFIPDYSPHITLRVLPGPQDDLFSEEGLAAFFSEQYLVTNEADRMGYRLEGPQISHLAKPDIVSDALCQGAIQIPGHGMPIIMLADRQTTGGYTKIGSVIGPDLWALAQAKPGDTVRFARCADEAAVRAFQAEQDTYLAISQSIGLSGDGAKSRRIFAVYVNGRQYHVEVAEG